MSVPVTVVTGFLGAGKTTFINGLLAQTGGRRIAAIVNDFGAINIDASLVSTRGADVIGLENGCVCCSLQGDLLRTVKSLLDRPEKFDQIVIEASGVADPSGIVQALMDPVLWKAVRLNAIVAVVAAQDCLDEPLLINHPLWRAQVSASDYIALSKSDGVDKSAFLPALAVIGNKLVVDLAAEAFPEGLLLDEAAPRGPFVQRAVLTSDRFVTVEGSWSATVPMAEFQVAIERLAPHLVRAKGIINFTEQPEKSYVFQLAGRRATLDPLDRREAETKLVLIGERERLDEAEARRTISALLGD